MGKLHGQVALAISVSVSVSVSVFQVHTASLVTP